ncbi:hypothetical protein MKW98_020955 [Papaver atlanticum]|uniref:Uncharacterized protein n=1 Tax=Papaver atlanticum TaxID=357466 RepID=A0AAD4XVF5_9MAGN|nr:hypothetical protein MKW98_020955 [Papaver atlanticum]
MECKDLLKLWTTEGNRYFLIAMSRAEAIKKARIQWGGKTFLHTNLKWFGEDKCCALGAIKACAQTYTLPPL